MRMVIRFVASLLLCAAVPAMAQDLTIVSKVTRDGGPPQTTVSFMSTDHVRMAGGEGTETIVDLKTGQMTTIDNKKKTYYVTTREDMDAFAAKMKERMNSPEMQKAQQEMKKVSPEDRKKMEDLMGGMMTVDVHKTGSSRKIAGYSCENWTITTGQFSRSEECLTNDLKFPMQAWQMYKGFADNMKTMMAAMGPMASSAAKMQEQYKKMKGYPLANSTTVDIMGHKSVTASEVTEIKRSPIPSSAWEIPAGYTKVDNPMLKAFQHQRR